MNRSRSATGSRAQLAESDVLDASILIVDDEVANVRLLERALRTHGYAHVHSTTDPHDVPEMYRRLRPDLVLLDLLMPGLDGFEVMRMIREIDGESYSPILVLTALGDRETRLRALRGGARDFLSKPFDLTELEIRVRNLLEVRRLNCRLARDQRQLAAVLDATEDAIVMYDRSRTLLFANHRCCDLFGADCPTLDTIRDRLAAPAQFDALIDRLFSSLQETHEEVVEALPPDKRTLYLYAAPVMGDEGDVLGRLFLFRDVSKDLEIDRMKEEIGRLRAELEQEYSFGKLIGRSEKMQEVYALMRHALNSDITVLIHGESGTGKELVAKSLHYNGPRRQRPFVAVNCAAIPDTLIESELFGHERGAFTGADYLRIGKFEQADGGTIFLDEIGEMPIALQAKLLRVLQEREVERIGGKRAIPIDVRVIAATNWDLTAAMNEGSFRKDLFFRIAEYPIWLPPLRDRPDDIPLLAEHFLARHSEDQKRRPIRLSGEALDCLMSYEWPGNVRELDSVIKRALLLETTGVLRASSLPPHVLAAGNRPAATKSSSDVGFLTLDQAERNALVRALDATGGNVQRCAEALGIDRSTLYRKLRKHNIVRK